MFGYLGAGERAPALTAIGLTAVVTIVVALVLVSQRTSASSSPPPYTDYADASVRIITDVRLAEVNIPDPDDPYHLSREALPPTNLTVTQTFELDESETPVRVSTIERTQDGAVVQESYFDRGAGTLVHRHDWYREYSVEPAHSFPFRATRGQFLGRGYSVLSDQGTTAMLRRTTHVPDGRVFEDTIVLADGFVVVDRRTELTESGPDVIRSLEVRSIQAVGSTEFPAFAAIRPSGYHLRDPRRTDTLDLTPTVVSALPDGLLVLSGSRYGEVTHTSGRVSPEDLGFWTPPQASAALAGVYRSSAANVAGFVEIFQSSGPQLWRQLERSIAAWEGSELTTIKLGTGENVSAWIAVDVIENEWLFFARGDGTVAIHAVGFSARDVASSLLTV